MKCPKCQYISFDSGDRCRNCGYEFSLAEAGRPAPDTDLPIQTADEAVGPLADFSLNETPALPLFSGGGGDRDAPDPRLVAAGATPRAPLSVRRAAPAAPRPRPRREPLPVEPRLALDTADLGPPPVAVPQRAAAEEPDVDDTQADSEPDSASNIATIGARVTGGAVDLLLLGTVDLIVLYFTLRICDLTFAQALTLPLVPFVAFLIILNGGYMAAFVAASGQTIGKMAAGTRVISADPGVRPQDRVSFEQAVLRAAASVISALPLGVGFLPAFFGGERRALHDRLADTRVVKA